MDVNSTGRDPLDEFPVSLKNWWCGTSATVSCFPVRLKKQVACMANLMFQGGLHKPTFFCIIHREEILFFDDPI
jgi:hypothetical protein